MTSPKPEDVSQWVRADAGAIANPSMNARDPQELQRMLKINSAAMIPEIEKIRIQTPAIVDKARLPPSIAATNSKTRNKITNTQAIKTAIAPQNIFLEVFEKKDVILRSRTLIHFGHEQLSLAPDEGCCLLYSDCAAPLADPRSPAWLSCSAVGFAAPIL